MDYVILTLKKMFRYILKPLSFLPALCMMYLIFSFSAGCAALGGTLGFGFCRCIC